MKLHNAKIIKDIEELRLEAYLPTKDDVWTIGWGHTKDVYKGMKITVEQAEQFFREDIAWAEAAVNNYVKVGLTQNQFDALVSFVFNIGTTHFKKSTALKRLNAGNYEGAAEAMKWWNKQKGKVLRGLINRRNEEVELFLSDLIVENTIPVNTAEANELKSIKYSKELAAGTTSVLGGLGAFMGGLGTEAQNNLSVALSVALIVVGAFFIVNRLRARKVGER